MKPSTLWRGNHRRIAAAVSVLSIALVLWFDPSPRTVQSLLGLALFWIGSEAASWLASILPWWIRWLLTAAAGAVAGFAIARCTGNAPTCAMLRAAWIGLTAGAFLVSAVWEILPERWKIRSFGNRIEPG